VLKMATDNEGKDFLLSGANCPLPSISRGPKEPASGCASIHGMVFREKSSGITVSGFRKRIYSPCAIATAWLLAFENPLLSLFSISVTSGNKLRTIVQLSSAE